MSKVFQVKGSTTDVTECELCGRTELKGTIVLQPLDIDGNAEGNVTYYGANCGAKAAGWTQKTIRVAAQLADREAARIAQAAASAAASAAYARWTTWLTEQTGETEILTATAKLGGFTAARAAYRAA